MPDKGIEDIRWRKVPGTWPLATGFGLGGEGAPAYVPDTIQPVVNVGDATGGAASEKIHGALFMASAGSRAMQALGGAGHSTAVVEWRGPVHEEGAAAFWYQIASIFTGLLETALPIGITQMLRRQAATPPKRAVLMRDVELSWTFDGAADFLPIMAQLVYDPSGSTSPHLANRTGTTTCRIDPSFGQLTETRSRLWAYQLTKTNPGPFGIATYDNPAAGIPPNPITEFHSQYPSEGRGLWVDGVVEPFRWHPFQAIQPFVVPEDYRILCTTAHTNNYASGGGTFTGLQLFANFLWEEVAFD